MTSANYLRLVACAVVAAGAWLGPEPVAKAENSSSAPAGLSNDAQAIHQQLRYRASCARLYAALTSGEQFNAATLLSDGRQLLAASGAQPTTISPEPGGTFTLFGGYITGRNLDMQPGVLLAQAWRTHGWAAGEYSVVRFALTQDASGCALTFDQRGFPTGEGGHLARGWYVHYWEPLRTLLDGS